MKLKYATIAAVISVVLLIFLGNFYIAAHVLKLGSDSGNIVAYVRGDSPLTAILLPEEASHLQDVKSIFSAVFLLFYIAAAASIILLTYLFLKRRKDFVNALLYGSISALAVCILLALLSANFSPFFMAFHKIFFPGGNWAFPEGTKLITLFTEEFFRRFFSKLLFNIALQSFTLLLIVAPFSELYAKLKKRFSLFG